MLARVVLVQQLLRSGLTVDTALISTACTRPASAQLVGSD